MNSGDVRSTAIGVGVGGLQPAAIEKVIVRPAAAKTVHALGKRGRMRVWYEKAGRQRYPTEGWNTDRTDG
jgi:hypothetical protein